MRIAGAPLFPSVDFGADATRERATVTGAGIQVFNIFNPQFTAYTQEYIDGFYKYTEEGTGRIYQLISMTGPGGASKGNPEYEVMGVKRHWRYSKENMNALIRAGMVVQAELGTVPRRKLYLDEGKGVPVQSLWDDIHALSGDDMLRMISEPGTYRPGGGETTYEMRDRVLGWLDSASDNDLTIAVTHGGPIAALLGTLRQSPVSEWASLIPRCGEIVGIHQQFGRWTLLSVEHSKTTGKSVHPPI